MRGKEISNNRQLPNQNLTLLPAHQAIQRSLAGSGSWQLLAMTNAALHYGQNAYGKHRVICLHLCLRDVHKTAVVQAWGFPQHGHCGGSPVTQSCYSLPS